jgi:hypothetical protein
MEILPRRFCNTKAQRHEDTKLFFKTKMLIIETCFQPIERLELIEPFERFLDTKARSFFKTKMLIIETCFQPIEHIEPFEP